VRAREAMVAASAVRPGEEDDWAGPTCQRERAGRAGWVGQRSRPSGGWWQRPNGRERGVGQPSWKERWAAVGSNPEPGQN
jgi:hypothetical protein